MIKLNKAKAQNIIKILKIFKKNTQKSLKIEIFLINFKKFIKKILNYKHIIKQKDLLYLGLFSYNILFKLQNFMCLCGGTNCAFARLLHAIRNR